MALGFRRRQIEEKPDLSQAYLDLIDRTQATIQFEPDGTIITANANFLGAMGYSASEIVGQHHSMFVDPDYAKSEAYAQFWRALGDGESFTDQFPRVAKDGSTVWIQATYGPVMGEDGKPVRVMKIATDITKTAERD